MSVFDDIEQAVFSTTQKVFGDTAVWKPSNEEVTQTEQVLFNCPTEPVQIGNTDRYKYQPFDYWFEYYISQFPSLKALVDSGTGIETISINGYELIVKSVKTKFDGRTYIAYCEING